MLVLPNLQVPGYTYPTLWNKIAASTGIYVAAGAEEISTVVGCALVLMD